MIKTTPFEMVFIIRDNMTIGTRINALRTDKGYTQEYIAEKLHVTRQAVSKWEQDQTSPDTWNLIELAKLLDTTVEYITLGKQEVKSVVKAESIQTETYCGRSCKSCKYKESLLCDGCKDEKSNKPMCQCDISGCCYSRKLSSCSLCKFISTCNKLSKKNLIPETRLKALKADVQMQEIRTEIVANCRTYTTVLPFAAMAYLVGTILSEYVPIFLLVAGVVYGVCLYLLTPHSDSYKTAAILTLSMTVLRVVAGFVPSENALFSLVLSSFAVVLDLFRLRSEYNGHQVISTYFDYDLSDSYSRLWKWYLIFPAVQIVALMFIGNPLLFFPAIVVLIGTLVGWVIVHVFHVRNLFRLSALMKR